MYNLATFSFSDMTRCGIQLRALGSNASSLEEVAERLVQSLHGSLRMDDGAAPACALVRLFITMPYSELEGGQQEFVRTLLGGVPERGTMKCLTLLATSGELPPWNSRQESAGHKALPLASEQSVSRSPMIAQLIQQLGVELGPLVGSDPELMLDREQHSFNVFHVANAAGSPFIPAQRDFVVPHGIRSVLGFGGLLPSGDLFATVLFTKCAVRRETAELFKTLALNVKVAMIPLLGQRVFR